jgi:hypothetical protein
LADFKALIALISFTVEKFNKNIPSIQKQMLEDVLLLIKQLDTKGDNIKVAGSNLKLLTQVQGRLQSILLNPQYVNSVKDYVKEFNQVTNLQNDYFKEIEAKFKPPKLAKEIQKQAVTSVVNQLTENGLNANVVDKVHNILRQAVTTGGSYATLSQQLTDFLVNNQSGDGQLLRYTKQITTDALNDFSGQYTQLISSDLGLEWFRYSGSNIETTRPFCLACTERKWFHISELPQVLKGEFEEFKKYDGIINKKTGLPNGMKPGTDISNFQVFRGGYNCEHQWRPCSEDIVPEDIKKRVYASLEYKQWKGLPIPKEDKPKPNPKKEDAAPVVVPSIIKELFSKYVAEVAKEELLKAINPSTHKDIVNYDSGGVSAVHKNADKVDLAESKITAELYAKLEGYIALVNEHVKKIGIKNPELTLNGLLADNKIPNHSDFTKGTEPYLNIASAISNGAKSAIKQKAIPIIVLETRYNLEDIIKGVRYGFEAVGKDGGKVSEIHLRYREEAITIISRKQFEDKTYVKEIESGYVEPL